MERQTKRWFIFSPAILLIIIILAIVFLPLYRKKYSDITIKIDQSSYAKNTYDAKVSVHVRSGTGVSISCEYLSLLNDVSKQKADSFVVVKRKEAEVVRMKIDSVLSHNEKVLARVGDLKTSRPN
jgi:hypothetical protein